MKHERYIRIYALVFYDDYYFRIIGWYICCLKYEKFHERDVKNEKCSVTTPAPRRSFLTR